VVCACPVCACACTCAWCVHAWCVHAVCMVSVSVVCMGVHVCVNGCVHGVLCAVCVQHVCVRVCGVFFLLNLKKKSNDFDQHGHLQDSK
jgi:hypothetical protein